MQFLFIEWDFERISTIILSLFLRSFFSLSFSTNFFLTLFVIHMHRIEVDLLRFACVHTHSSLSYNKSNKSTDSIPEYKMTKNERTKIRWYKKSCIFYNVSKIDGIYNFIMLPLEMLSQKQGIKMQTTLFLLTLKQIDFLTTQTTLESIASAAKYPIITRKGDEWKQTPFFSNDTVNAFNEIVIWMEIQRNFDYCTTNPVKRMLRGGGNVLAARERRTNWRHVKWTSIEWTKLKLKWIFHCSISWTFKAILNNERTNKNVLLTVEWINY